MDDLTEAQRPYRVLVCGGRDYQDWEVFRRTLNGLRPKPTVIIEGGAKGADDMAHAWAHLHGLECIQIPADWEKHGKAAGPIRNRRMLVEGKPDLVVAFPGGRGTADMVRQATLAGVRVMDVTEAQREAYEERAAIMEFDGKLSREQAEAEAWRIVTEGAK